MAEENLLGLFAEEEEVLGLFAEEESVLPDNERDPTLDPEYDPRFEGNPAIPGSPAEARYDRTQKAQRDLERFDELDEIGTKMYEDFDGSPLNMEQAKAKRHEITQEHGQTIMQNGVPVVVPFPQSDLTEDAAGVGLSQNIAGGALNAVKQGVITAAVLGDAAIETLKDVPRAMGVDLPKQKTAEILDSMIPEWNPQGFLDEFQTMGSQLLIGGVFGDKGAKAAASKASQKFSNQAAKDFAQEGTVSGIKQTLPDNLSRAVLQEMGMTATMDPDEETLFGHMLLSPFIEGTIGEDGTYNQDHIAKKMAILVDAGIMGGLGSKALNLIGWTGGFVNSVVVKPAADALSKDRQRTALGRDILENLGAIAPDATPEQARETTLRLSELIKEGMEKYYDTGIEGFEYAYVSRDTMSALEYGLRMNPDAFGDRHNVVLQRLKEIRTGKSMLPNLNESLGQYSKEFVDVAKAGQKQFGGDEAIKTSAARVAENLKEPVTNLEKAIAGNETALETAEASVRQILQDPLVSKQLGQVGEGKLNLSKLYDEPMKKIVSTLNQVKEGMDIVKNDLYDKIPDTATADMQSIEGIVGKIPQFKERFPKLAKSIEDSNGNFRHLYNDTRLVLKDEIDVAIGKDPYARELIELRDNINKDQLDFLAVSDDLETVAAVEEARSYFIEEYAPFWRDSQLELIGRLSDKTLPTRPVNAMEESFQVLETTFGGKKPLSAEVVVEALGVAGKEGEVVSMAIGKIANEIDVSRKLDTPLSEVELQPYLKTLGKIGAALEEKAPEQFKRVQTFMDQLTAGQMSKVELKAKIEESNKLLDKAKKEQIESVLAPILNTEGKGKTNAYSVFKKFMSDPDDLSAFNKIIEENKDNPEVMDGLKAAYFQYSKEAWTTVQESVSGARGLNNNEWKKFVDTDSNWVKLADGLFGEDSDIALTQYALLEAMASQSLSKKGIELSSGNFQTAAQGATNVAVTAIFGVLDRLGARVRSAASSGIRRMDNDANNIHEAFLTNPREFTDMLEKLAEYDNKGMTKESKDMMRQIFVRSLIYDGDADPVLDEAIDQEYEEKSTYDKAIDGGAGIVNKGADLYNNAKESVTNTVGDWLQ